MPNTWKPEVAYLLMGGGNWICYPTLFKHFLILINIKIQIGLNQVPHALPIMSFRTVILGSFSIPVLLITLPVCSRFKQKMQLGKGHGRNGNSKKKGGERQQWKQANCEHLTLIVGLYQVTHPHPHPRGASDLREVGQHKDKTDTWPCSLHVT